MKLYIPLLLQMSILLLLTSCGGWEEGINSADIDLYSYYLSDSKYAYELTEPVGTVDSLPSFNLQIGDSWIYYGINTDVIDRIPSFDFDTVIVKDIQADSTIIIWYSVSPHGEERFTYTDTLHWNGNYTVSPIKHMPEDYWVLPFEVVLSDDSYLPNYRKNIIVMDDSSLAWNTRDIYSSHYGKIVNINNKVLLEFRGVPVDVGYILNEFKAKTSSL